MKLMGASPSLFGFWIAVVFVLVVGGGALKMLDDLISEHLPGRWHRLIGAVLFSSVIAGLSWYVREMVERGRL